MTKSRSSSGPKLMDSDGMDAQEGKHCSEWDATLEAIFAMASEEEIAAQDLTRRRKGGLQ